MGLGQKILTRVIFLLLGLGWFSHLWVLKISAKNPKFFNFFPFRPKKILSSWVKKYSRVEDRSAPYLLQVKSMFGLAHL